MSEASFVSRLSWYRPLVAVLVVAALASGICSGCAPSDGLPPTDQASIPTSSLEPIPAATAETTPVAVETPPEEPETPALAIELLAATVVRVVDGDTAVFRLEDGRQERVRFIGVDTPESTNSIEPYGKEASAYTSAALQVGSSVYLEQDVESRDRYGRLLAYVWLEKPSSDSESQVRKKMLNAKLALDGYAQQMTIQPNSKYAQYFRAFIAEAREAERGLWNPDLDTPAAAAPKPVTQQPVKKRPPSGTPYIGNMHTSKFHYAACDSVGQMSESNKVGLKSRFEAIGQGYVPCTRCNP